jgi:hypothetical protein
MMNQYTVTSGPSAPEVIFIRNAQGKVVVGVVHGNEQEEWNRISKQEAVDLAFDICQYLNDSAA